MLICSLNWVNSNVVPLQEYIDPSEGLGNLIDVRPKMLHTIKGNQVTTATAIASDRSPFEGAAATAT